MYVRCTIHTHIGKLKLKPDHSSLYIRKINKEYPFIVKSFNSKAIKIRIDKGKYDLQNLPENV